jgi:membrane protease YdiL (CAAX protease family)
MPIEDQKEAFNDNHEKLHPKDQQPIDDQTTSLPDSNANHPLGTVFIAICVALGLQMVLPVVFSGAFDMMFGTSLRSGLVNMRLDSEMEQILMKLTIIFTQTFAFGGVAVAIAWLSAGRESMLSMNRLKNPVLIPISVIVALSALPIIPYLMIPKEWIQLPESMKALQDVLLGQEEQTEKYLSVLLKHHFPLNLLFIAITPAIMEELFFRGMMLNQIRKVFNIHVAIWSTGFLFSLFHFQILGFFPRMLLGVVFGYLAYWSGSLIPCIIAHFTNNAMSAIAYYVGKDDANTDSVLAPDYQPPIAYGMVGLVVLAGLMYLFYYYARSSEGSR